tara:strand:+ start:6738 stop:7034 length:297 start_codon:yes stop_codon:yes gene_type:complete
MQSKETELIAEVINKSLREYDGLVSRRLDLHTRLIDWDPQVEVARFVDRLMVNMRTALEGAGDCHESEKLGELVFNTWAPYSRFDMKYWDELDEQIND